MRFLFALTVAAALSGTSARSASAADPSIKDVLTRTAAYVAEFQRRLSGIVAEELYRQQAHARPLTQPMTLTLRSDLVLVKPTDANDWVQYRDVFEVDGAPVRDREERLSKLFLQPSEPGQSQLMQILNESARYNIGAVIRNVNTPLFTLKFLDASQQHRFRFQRSRDVTPPAGANDHNDAFVFRTSTEVWEIEFREVERPTIIRDVRGRSVAARGRVWVEPATGRVLMTELTTSDHGVRSRIDVSFQSEPVLGMLVPIEMREHYERGVDIVDARASYGHFRQFQVNVDQTFLLKK